MKRTGLFAGLATVAVAAAVLTAAWSAEGPRVASVKHLMGGIVGPNCSALVGALKGDLDGDAKAKAIQNAALINEAGHLLMDNKRRRSATWEKAANILRACSDVVIKKIEAGDLEGANAALNTLRTQGCAACHKAHRK